MPSHCPMEATSTKRRVTLTPVLAQQQGQPAPPRRAAVAHSSPTRMRLARTEAEDGSESSSDDDVHYEVKVRKPPPSGGSTTAAIIGAKTTIPALSATNASTAAMPTREQSSVTLRNFSVVPEQNIVDLMGDSSEHSDDGGHAIGGSSQAAIATKKKEMARTATANSKPTLQLAAAAPAEDNTFAAASDDEQDEFPPTIQQLACQCWSCHVTLKFPQHRSNNGENAPFCLYAMHVHPLLGVPICSYCVEEVVGLPTPDTADESAFMLEHDVEGWCHACAEMDPETLLLCDSCPRTYCLACVGQALGGGKRGMSFAQTLQQDDDALWSCPFCEPPKQLLQLQKELNLTAEDDSACNAATASRPPRRPEDIISELSIVEEEKKACEAWDSPEKMQSKRNEIRQELATLNPDASNGELEEMVDDEIQQWMSLCTKHDHRLSDMASSLQDELEALGFDLARCYDRCLGMGMQPEGEEPSWKRAADQEVARFYAEHTAAQNPSAPEVYSLEIPDEVDDLMTRDEDCDPDKLPHSYNAWRAAARPTEEAVKDAARFEEERIVQKKGALLVRHRVDDAHDKEVDEEEDRKVSRCGIGGVSRVRRDKWVTALVARQKASQHTLSSALGRPLAYAVTAVPKAPSASTAFAAKPPNVNVEKRAAMAKKRPPPPREESVIDLTEDSPVALKQRPTEPFTPVGTRVDSNIEIDSPGPLGNMKPFARSKLILSDATAHGRKSKRIAVATELEKQMKPHQKEGIKFIWKNTFIDLDVRRTRDEKLDEDNDVGGCILAHNMGLGKSLTAVALVHTLLTHPSLRVKNPTTTVERLVHTVLLVVPVNTLANWKNEFSKWTGNMSPSILVHDLTEHNSSSRRLAVDHWQRTGDVLLVSKDLFPRLVENIEQLQKPDVVILDEAHLMLSAKENKIYKALAGIETKRRVLLTGSPLQNNLLEYFRMCEWMRPSVLNMSESEFDKEYAVPIKLGMAKDASPAVLLRCDQKSRELNQKLASVVHRKDAAVLRRELPPMQQVILHIHPTKVQTNLCTRLRKFEKQHDITGYLERYHLARPIHNHPACLMMSSSDPEEDAVLKKADKDSIKPWWSTYVDKNGAEKLKAINSGGKVVLLMHILTHARNLGDRVVVFSQCLKTLDFIEEVLNLDCWADHLPSLAKAFPGTKLGKYTKGTEYLRIDGATQAGERGKMVTKFNNTEEVPTERVQLFLISIKAGNVGINLIGANRVVLFDAHFNPTQLTQALYRCYRYGQEKPVFAYRFLAEGTGEEKIYSRSVNKTGVSLRVIDGKLTSRHFSNAELQQLVENDTWVQCDRCQKWRMLKDSEGDLPEEWFCEMNTSDPVNSTCEASEKDKGWYCRHFRLEDLAFVAVGSEGGETTEKKYAFAHSPAKPAGSGATETSTSEDEQKELLTKKDEILMGLLKVSENGQKSSYWIRKYYFHETLLEVPDDDSAAVAQDVEAAVESKKAALSVTAQAESTSRCSEHIGASISSVGAKKQASASTFSNIPSRTSEQETRTDVAAKESLSGRSQTSNADSSACQDRRKKGDEAREVNAERSATSTSTGSTLAVHLHVDRANGSSRGNCRSRSSQNSQEESPELERAAQVELGDGMKDHGADLERETKENLRSPKKQPFSKRRIQNPQKRRLSLQKKSPTKKTRREESKPNDDPSSGDEASTAVGSASIEQSATAGTKRGPTCDRSEATKKAVPDSGRKGSTKSDVRNH